MIGILFTPAAVLLFGRVLEALCGLFRGQELLLAQKECFRILNDQFVYKINHNDRPSEENDSLSPHFFDVVQLRPMSPLLSQIAPIPPLMEWPTHTLWWISVAIS